MSPRWGDPKPENAYLSNWMAGIDRTAEQCKAIIENTDAEYEATADRYQKAADQQSQIEEAAASYDWRVVACLNPPFPPVSRRTKR
jgi:hypothetical protein